ncbi:hypothetical protein AADG42_06095 [Ammonicoccus fulvus]|uniref:Uncharacterized protein n=1 Tax=Ammonicoccus fulvus TaxID=3138240 RepID=A0ABZ3FQJ1_9ACTN
MSFRAALRTRVCAAVLVLSASALVAGCSASGPAPVPEPSPVTASAEAYAVPAGGVSLAQLGFGNGPADRVTVPAGARLNLRVDQPNMQTMTFSAPEASVIAQWLQEHLPGAGFTITASGVDAGGLVFTGHGWDGAFTSGGAEAALTLRRSTHQG